MKNRIIILSVLFLAIILIDGGKNILIGYGKVQHVITDVTNTESEVPDNILSSLWDDIRLFNSYEQRPEITSRYLARTYPNFSLKTIDFSGFVWQPPKFL